MNSYNPSDGFLPDGVVIQILVRLPVKSLMRFKCVCKLWSRLTSDSYFIQLYNQVSVKNPMVLIDATETSESKTSLICVDYLRGVFEFSLDFIKDRVKIRASCNGLLCCSSIPDKGVYYVCNPLTRELKSLPRSRERPTTRFHPDDEDTLAGIACDFSTQKFSVVLAGHYRPFGHRPDKTFTCMVYDSETNRWRKFVSFLDNDFTQMSRNQVVFVNDALHWLMVNSSCILVLYLHQDSWRKIQLPAQICCGIGQRMYLLDSDGCLSIVQISDAWMSIWVLRDYMKEEWELVDKVSLRCIRGLVPGIFPISQTNEYLFLATHRQVLVYHRRSRVWKEMYSVKYNSILPLWFLAHAFRGTMFSCR